MFPCIMIQYTKMTNKMQLCRIIYYSLAALHASSDIFAHHQEHLNCITASVITHVCRCRLVSWECLNSFQQYNLLFLGCSTCFERYFRSSSGTSKLYYSFWYYTRMSLPSGIMGVLERVPTLPLYQPAAICVCNTRSCNTV